MSTEYVSFFNKKSTFGIRKPNERKLIKAINKALSSMDFLETEEEKIKSTKVFQELVEEKKKNVIIDAFFKDLVKDPYTSVLLMIVDDNGKSAGKKRNVLLGKDYKKIAVTSRKVKKTFCAYFTFQN